VTVGNPNRHVTLTESGSSLVLPYLQKMVAPVHSDYPAITLAPAGGGSGRGVSDAIGGAVVMGGSDAYLSDGQAAQNRDLLDIPIAVSAQAINYNLPGVNDLRLSGSRVTIGTYDTALATQVDALRSRRPTQIGGRSVARSATSSSRARSGPRRPPRPPARSSGPTIASSGGIRPAGTGPRRSGSTPARPRTTPGATSPRSTTR
jgi:hypothetical protein